MEKTGWSALQSRPPYSTIVRSDVMLGCNESMKKQTGVLIDSQVWDAYRELCRCEKVRPSELISELLRRAR
jgi:hypothetical protein